MIGGGRQPGGAVKPTPTMTPTTRAPGVYDPDWEPPEPWLSVDVPGGMWSLLAAAVVLAVVLKGFPLLSRGGGLLTLTRRRRYGYGGGRIQVGAGRGERLALALIGRASGLMFAAANITFAAALYLNVWS
jgi:hypothetical protein